MEARFESKRFHGSSSKHYGHKNSRIFCSRRSGVFRRSQAWVSSTRTSNWSSYLDRKVSIMKFLNSLDFTHNDTTNSIYKINQTILYIRCTCPPGYKGNFCELCVPGYYHENNGGPFARCIPCSCNGHTEFCDRETGNANDIPILISK